MPNLPFLCQFIDGIVNVPVDPFSDFLAERSLSPRDRVAKEKVLILTKDYDVEASLVGINLRSRGIDFVRLNVNDVPHRLRIRYSLNPGSHLRIEITVGKQILETSDIQVILLRHFDTREMNYYFHDELARTFSLQQWEDAFQILQNNLNCEWISDPYANRQAGDRIKQLLTARDLGLAIPATLITNDPSEARDFYHSFSGNVILKAIHHHSIEANGKVYYMFTHELLDEELARLDDLVHAPCILQQHLIKKSDLRVTVVGSEVFATQIDSPMSSNGNVDLHRCPLPQLSFRTKELDDTTRRACVKLIHSLGLRYGAIDFVIDGKNDQPIFLELNPTGDWYWIERKTGQSISKAMVDLIEKLF
jgi:glutathione synthase/RimK-type ligase-like ATP-grasp enzyme